MKNVLKTICASVVLVSVLLAGASSVFPMDTLKIGLIYSLSGPGAPVGKLQEQGAKLAISDINAVGGVDLGGRKAHLEAVIADDQTKPPTAAEAFQKLLKDGVKAIVGCTFAHIGLALNNEARGAKVFYMASCAVPDDYFKKDVKAPYSSCIICGSEDSSRPAIRYMLQDMKAKRVALFVPAYALGQAAVKVFEAEVKKYPGVKYEIFWHPVGNSNMRRDLTRVAEYRPDVLYIQSWGQDAINALDEARNMRLDMPIMYFWLMNAYATNISPEAMKGVKAAMWWYHDMAGFKDPDVVKASDEFTANYMKAYNIPPDPYAMAAYYAVKETVRAIELAKSTDPDKMYSALMANPEWKGAKGPAKWRKDGRSDYKYFAWIVQGKGSEERKVGKYDSKFDFARTLDVVSGEDFLPKLEDSGY
jgi:branched-chain amino acid transport system substrate-binding protein